MKYKLLLIPLGFTVALTGCIHSHMRDQAMIDAGGVTTAPVATSTRPAVRVYGDTPAPIVAPGVVETSPRAVVVTPEVRNPVVVQDAPATTVAPMDDMDRAVAIRNMLQNDNALRLAAKNVDIEIKNGAAILRGTVRSETERQLLEQRIGAYPGVTSMQDRLVIAP
jgi:hypothetical protein